VIRGIIYVIKNGLQWKDAPQEYGSHKTLYNRFVRWSKMGIFNRIFAELAGREETPERLMIDASISKPIPRQPCWYEVEPVCDLLGDWVLMCNGSQWKTVVLAFNAVFGSE
jgi:hypothetical protein